MTAFTPNNRPVAASGPGTALPTQLGGAVDLSRFSNAAVRPGEQTPTEFRVAVAGDANGRPHVLMTFGHLQWLFEPYLATDLGSVLLDAARKAEAIARGEQPPQEEEKQ